jgi:hypothetical protein
MRKGSDPQFFIILSEKTRLPIFKAITNMMRGLICSKSMELWIFDRSSEEDLSEDKLTVMGPDIARLCDSLLRSRPF